MRVVWDKEDIFCGLVVKRDGDNISKGILVGYVESDRVGKGWDRANLCLISLDDGVIIRQQTHEEIAQWLTRNNEMPITPVWGRQQTNYGDK